MTRIMLVAITIPVVFGCASLRLTDPPSLSDRTGVGGAVEIAKASLFEGNFALGKDIQVVAETFAPVPDFSVRLESIRFEFIDDVLEATIRVDPSISVRSGDYRCDVEVELLAADRRAYARLDTPLFATSADAVQSATVTKRSRIFLKAAEARNRVQRFRLTLRAMELSHMRSVIEGPITLDNAIRIELAAPGAEPPIELTMIEFTEPSPERAAYLYCNLFVTKRDLRGQPWQVGLEVLNEEGKRLCHVYRTFRTFRGVPYRTFGPFRERPYFPMGDVLVEEADRFRLSLIPADANAPVGISGPFGLQEGDPPETRWLPIWLTAHARPFDADVRGILFTPAEDGGMAATLHTEVRTWLADKMYDGSVEKTPWQVRLDMIDDRGRNAYHDEITFSFTSPAAPKNEIRRSGPTRVNKDIELSLDPDLDVNSLARYEVSFRALPRL